MARTTMTRNPFIASRAISMGCGTDLELLVVLPGAAAKKESSFVAMAPTATPPMPGVTEDGQAGGPEMQETLPPTPRVIGELVRVDFKSRIDTYDEFGIGETEDALSLDLKVVKHRLEECSSCPVSRKFVRMGESDGRVVSKLLGIYSCRTVSTVALARPILQSICIRHKMRQTAKLSLPINGDPVMPAELSVPSSLYDRQRKSKNLKSPAIEGPSNGTEAFKEAPALSCVGHATFCTRAVESWMDSSSTDDRRLQIRDGVFQGRVIVWEAKDTVARIYGMSWTEPDGTARNTDGDPRSPRTRAQSRTVRTGPVPLELSSWVLTYGFGRGVKKIRRNAH
ncbi:hypothetical protein B0H11DRAFT_1908590 [Mycena galericulata]|nr:hypothetical protein B0H11DRAFT_1908590 [Mycena galericulata]